MSQRKESAVAFLKMAGTGEVRVAYDRFIAPGFIHHNPYFKGDRQSLLDAMEHAHRASPNKAVEVQRAFEDGDHVITHSRVVRRDPAASEIAVVHIFRFEGDRVAELWDLGMELPDNLPNENGAF